VTDAVHIPLSPEAQVEASVLMLVLTTSWSPASGSHHRSYAKILSLACTNLTKGKPGAKGEGRTFANIDEVLLALEPRRWRHSAHPGCAIR